MSSGAYLLSMRLKANSLWKLSDWYRFAFAFGLCTCMSVLVSFVEVQMSEVEFEKGTEEEGERTKQKEIAGKKGSEEGLCYS